MKNKSFTIREEVELSETVDIDINVEEYIDEIIEIILGNEDLCAKVVAKYEEYKKNKTDLLEKYPEIELYKFNFDRLFIMSINDRSYIITDRVTIFSKRHKLDIESKDAEWKIVFNNDGNNEYFIQNLLNFVNNVENVNINPSINNEKQFTKNDGDFLIQFKSLLV